jgi:hypothetical protein
MARQLEDVLYDTEVYGLHSRGSIGSDSRANRRAISTRARCTVLLGPEPRG